MLSFTAPSIYHSPKCFVTYGTMGHPDPKQLPAKGKPWSSFLAQDFVDLVLPQGVAEAVKDRLEAAQLLTPTYHRVIMKLGQVLEGDFFTEYIKLGNVIMLSAGRLDADDVFTLKDGTLSLYLAKETYERAGLIGKPYGVKGKRGIKPRWIVEYDLRHPSMLHGKKGFERLLSACHNVLNKPVTWLFRNISEVPSSDPLQKHFPVKYTSAPGLSKDLRTLTPRLAMPHTALNDLGHLEFDEYSVDIYEWLSLIRLQSPRVAAGDNVDQYISTYTPPGHVEEIREEALCKLTWEGFMPSSWTQRLLAEIVLAVTPKQWFALSTTAFAKGTIGEASECTLMRPPNAPGEYFLWDIHGHS
ncbi:ribonuclease P 40kDa subunit [Microdochium trichocladiopsis]|uniref:Ribonuclease P 40kDa subunit n=1 Tax=Microdochium trichocladiopsis TaxID=1682393 RepID=A0A9P8YIG7_9PEZI|nr:ribonuclease P 40kDa subunit [Microdochium trichocladiopsis]KAH7039609.1 ribonuclease P 40kDa subunit [Microdochium trichocladiopsis]